MMKLLGVVSLNEKEVVDKQELLCPLSGMQNLFKFHFLVLIVFPARH